MMIIRILLITATVALTVQANAENYRDMEPLKLEAPEMKAISRSVECLSRSVECGVWSENTSAAESALEHISLLPPHSSLLEKVSFPPREMQITLSDKYRIHINRL
jgi:hypothetical protein